MALNNRKIFDHATDIRKFEIGLFWQRSLFFWGFIAAAFVAYAEMIKETGKADLALAVGGFGLVCSVAWTLGNRGSKYWQENWEQKVQDVQHAILGKQLYTERKPIKNPGVWSAQRYSVSRLTIALSDFTALVWLALMIKAAATIDWNSQTEPCFGIVIIAVSVGYVIAMLIGGRSRT